IHWGTVVTPAPGVPSILAVSSFSITAQWLSNGNQAGALYSLQLSSTDFDGTGAVPSSGTYLTIATVSGLLPNTTYWLQVNATFNSTTSADLPLGSTSTLTELLSGATIYSVYFTSVTVNWAA